MNYWPSGMKTDPMGEWPGEHTAHRVRSPFSATLSSTMADFRREMAAIAAQDVRLQIDLPAEKFRLDGNPRSDAVPRSPALILTFRTKLGAQSFPCDTFTRWEDNLRAIVLSLEALRKVDRYGVTKRGEQYRGFLALEATAMPAGFATADAAEVFIKKVVADAGFAYDFEPPLSLMVRHAKRAAHPDMPTGDDSTFQRVTLAEDKLRAEGRI